VPGRLSDHHSSLSIAFDRFHSLSTVLQPPSNRLRTVHFDLRTLLERHAGRGHELHAEHVNPRFATVLRTIGYDRDYVRAEGPHLFDREGNRYLDFLGGYAVCNFGRNHPTIRRALEDALSLDLASMVQFEAPVLSGLLAAELKRRVGRGLDHVFFTNSGTEGVEAAIKFAKCATGRPALLHAPKAFHGLSSGSVSLNGCESFREGFAPFLPGCRMVAFDDLAALERELARGDVAAFVIEPIQGKGFNIHSPGYLAEAARLCHRHGALFVADEVQTGLGRTGSFLAIDQEDGARGAVEPDMVVLSKALSGGYVPVGAVLVKGEVWRKVFTSLDRAIVHSSTFHQGALAMTAGLASLAAYDETNAAENARKMGARIKAGIEALMPRYEMLKQVRQRGLMIGIEFGAPKSLLLKANWAATHAMDRNLFAQAVVVPLMEDHRVLCQVAGHNQDVVKLIPPLVIDDSDVDWFLRAFERVMAGLHTPAATVGLLARLGRNAMFGGRRDRSEPSEAARP
jgi:acetylornithine/succinyldiaminopimelate/putrescine aminotransferase